MPDFGIGKKHVSSGAAGEADAGGVRIFKEGFPLVNGPYIKDGKPNGRPKLWGKKKLEFEWAVYNAQLDSDGVLRDPHTGEVIDWKPGQPRKGVCDFGHKKTKYSEIFEKYRTGEISLERLKEIQFNPRNFQIQTINSNRSHRYEGL
ncbi:MAG: HNH endonuclease [Coriobacteriaceae bacterium]|nr:HNH endonuclease [Coriobacteriaceae bacterium]